MLEYSFTVHIMFIAVQRNRCVCRITAPALRLSATATIPCSWLGYAATLSISVSWWNQLTAVMFTFSLTQEESWVWHRIQHQPWFQRTHGLCSGKWCWRVCVDFFQGHKVCWAPSSSAVIASSHILVQKCHLHWWKKSRISSNSWMGIFLKWWASWVYFALVHLCTRCPVALTGTAGHRHLRI